jgi:hypothetical protein
LVSRISGSSPPTYQTFTWNAVSSASWYRLWVNDNSGTRFDKWYEAATVGCASGTGTCSVSAEVSLQPGPIFWWVQTWNNAGGDGPWSAVATYTLEPLASPTLIDPSGSLSDWPNVQFRWDAVPYATYYYLWVTDGSGIVQVQTWYPMTETNCASGNTCSITLTPTLSPGTAWWWVQAWNPSTGYSAWSAGLQFIRP